MRTLLAGLVLAAVAVIAKNDTTLPRRQAGLCAISTESCGSKGGIFGQPLPCARSEPAVSISERGGSEFLSALSSVCGDEVASTWQSTCCDQSSLDTLSASLQQAQAFIAMCPACSLSFRNFYCHFTCSPDQSTFVSVSQTQSLDSKKGPAVKSLELHVDEQFGKAFFDACKDVKFAATNGFAMEFIGGGARDWLSFLRYMGKEVRCRLPLPRQQLRWVVTVAPRTWFAFPDQFPSASQHLQWHRGSDHPALESSATVVRLTRPCNRLRMRRLPRTMSRASAAA